MTKDNKRNSSETAPSSRLALTIVVLVSVLPIVSTIAYGAVDSVSIGLLSILVAVIAVLWLADAAGSGEFRFSSNLLQLPIAGLIAIGCVQLLPLGGTDPASSLLSVPATTTLSMDPYSTRLFLIRLAICFVFFSAALVYIHGRSRQKNIALVIVTFGALIAFFGILQRLAMPESIYGLRPTPQAIPFGPYVNQHHFAALMEMTSGVALGLMFGYGIERERKIFLAIAAGIMGIAIIFTGSRGGLISYLGVIAFAALTSFARGDAGNGRDPDTMLARNRNLLVVTAAAGLIILVLGSVLFLGGENSLLRGIGLQESQADVTSGRAHFWNIALQVFMARPILGAGFDAFGVAFTTYDTWNGTYRVEQAHNDYLQMLADAGILGFACVAAFVILLMKSGIAAIVRRGDDIQRSIVAGALAGCFGILIHSFFDFPLRTPANALFFLLLVVLAVGNNAEKNKRTRRGNSSGR